MTTQTFRTPSATPVTVALTAPNLELSVEAVPGLTEATFHLSGPEEIVRQAIANAIDGAWIITVPQPRTTVPAGSGMTVIAGDVYGGVVMSGGRTVINGVSMSGSAPAEPLRARLRIPQGSLVGTRIDNGSVTTSGELSGVHHQGRNSSLSVHSVGGLVAKSTNGSVTVGRASGEIDVETTNGTVFIGRTGPLTKARTTNGNVVVSAGSHGRITAQTTNGNVTVDKSGYRVNVTTHTTNGHDRVL
ncbi:hypothetical protein ACFW31_24590 [Nocardiopsis alba]|uniref:hypothetical protein n=1 Tax=Nocardiopsis alba TaxID=53437 RepID=UPI00366EDECE